MNSKKCFKCNEIRPLNEFYKHKGMCDGHLNKCKHCTIKDSSERLSKLRSDDKWIEKERYRGREKYRRLDYYNKYSEQRQGPKKMESTNRFRELYPEKYKAYIKTHHMKKVPGHSLHHWSYNDEHHKDVISIANESHYLLHRHIIYDQTHKMFRTKDGVLLSSKEMHINFINKLNIRL